MNVAIFLDDVNEFNGPLKRPEYIAHRDFTPIECLPDGCLITPYEVALPWKDGTPEQALKPLSQVASSMTQRQ